MRFELCFLRSDSASFTYVFARQKDHLFPGWDQVDELGRVRLELGSDINRYLIIMDCTVKSGN